MRRHLAHGRQGHGEIFRHIPLILRVRNKENLPLTEVQGKEH